jgi:beta-lactamase regulating signal transducer with metallopeptidase domain
MTSWLEFGLSNALLATCLGLLAWIITRFCRHPKVVFCVWLLVLAKLLVPPVLGIPWQGWRVADLVDAPADETFYAFVPPAVALPSPELKPGRKSAASPAPSGPSFPAPAAASAPPMSQIRAQTARQRATPPPAQPIAKPWRLPSVRTVLCITWITGSVLWLMLAVVRMVRFQRWLVRARLAPSELQAEVAALAERMHVRRAPRVRLVDAQLPPLVWALIGRGTIVLPSALVDRLSTDQRATLLAHELVHLKRRDHLVRLLEMAALAIYWWHPVAWFARRQIARAGEACCDAAVVARFPKLAGAYAAALLATVDFLSGARPALPVGSSGISQVSQLRRRLEMILAGTGSRRVSWPLRLSLAALALAVLPFFVHSVAAAPKPFQPKPGTIEQRLSRLEKAMQELTEEIRAMHKAQMDNAPATVVKTVPETGDQNVDPNMKEIKVVFSRDMQDGSWSWTGGGDTFPETTGEPRYLKDKRTCVLPVKLEPGKTYSIGINSGRFLNFKDSRGMSSIPYPLDFKTR